MVSAKRKWIIEEYEGLPNSYSLAQVKGQEREAYGLGTFSRLKEKLDEYVLDGK